MDTKNKIFTIIGSIALVATATVGGYTLFATKDTAATPVATSSSVASTSQGTASTADTTATATSSTSSTSSTGSYKDGTYTAVTSYSVPKGAQNSITATVTIVGGNITTVKTSNNYSDHESGMYVADFDSSVSSDASGQSIASYSPSRIGGASLTTMAFSDALDTIRNQAKA